MNLYSTRVYQRKQVFVGILRVWIQIAKWYYPHSVPNVRRVTNFTMPTYHVVYPSLSQSQWEVPEEGPPLRFP